MNVKRCHTGKYKLEKRVVQAKRQHAHACGQEKWGKGRCGKYI